MCTGLLVSVASPKSIDRGGLGESRTITPRDFKTSVQTHFLGCVCLFVVLLNTHTHKKQE